MLNLAAEMEFLGYIGALAVGISLGVFGAGGSIIAIPVLIFFFGYEPLQATTYSFFIVGTTALIGAVQNIRNKHVKIMPAMYFAVSGMLSIYLIRTFILNLIPGNLFTVNNYLMTRDHLILLFFSIVMASSGISMIVSEQQEVSARQFESYPGVLRLVLLGFSVGIIIAFAGVGGGFLITPALILFAKLPVRSAIGTSLCIISLNSFVGFVSSMKLHESIDWEFLLLFVAITAVGILGGNRLTKGIPNQRMKRVFGVFVLVMSIVIGFYEFSS